jgi:hypothetical protein
MMFSRIALLSAFLFGLAICVLGQLPQKPQVPTASQTPGKTPTNSGDGFAAKAEKGVEPDKNTKIVMTVSWFVVYDDFSERIVVNFDFNIPSNSKKKKHKNKSSGMASEKHSEAAKNYANTQQDIFPKLGQFQIYGDEDSYYKLRAVSGEQHNYSRPPREITLHNAVKYETPLTESSKKIQCDATLMATASEDRRSVLIHADWTNWKGVDNVPPSINAKVPNTGSVFIHVKDTTETITYQDCSPSAQEFWEKILGLKPAVTVLKRILQTYLVLSPRIVDVRDDVALDFQTLSFTDHFETPEAIEGFDWPTRNKPIVCDKKQIDTLLAIAKKDKRFVLGKNGSIALHSAERCPMPVKCKVFLLGETEMFKVIPLNDSKSFQIRQWPNMRQIDNVSVPQDSYLLLYLHHEFTPGKDTRSLQQRIWDWALELGYDNPNDRYKHELLIVAPRPADPNKT